MCSPVYHIIVQARSAHRMLGIAHSRERAMKHLIAFILILIAPPVFSGPLTERPGWAVHKSTLSFQEMLEAVPSAVKAQKLAIVTQAGPTGAAARRGITIPGNRVMGVYNNDFAVRVLNLSTAAMIEAPIRLYVTENEDGTATLSYKLPSYVFAPYFDEGGAELQSIAAELDTKFAAIAAAID